MINSSHPTIESRFFNYLLLNASYNDKIGLLDGKAAVTLYSYYLGHTKKDEWINNISFSFLQETLSQINLYTPLTYGNGIAGIGVLLEYLAQQGYLEENTNELLEESEPYLLSAIYSAKLQEISIANGISGLGFYLLRRLQSETPAHSFQQLRFKESVIACVDQIAGKLQREEYTSSDLSVFTGLTGVCLFLNEVNRLRYFEPLTIQLLEKFIGVILHQLNNTPFSWQKAEVYFGLLHCELIKSNAKRKAELIQSFNIYIYTANTKKESIGFYDACFVALWLRLAAEQHNTDKAKFLSNEIMTYAKDVLKNKSLSELFPYDVQKQCVPIGLHRGVCGTALPLHSLETGDCRWLSILGIHLPAPSVGNEWQENILAENNPVEN